MKLFRSSKKQTDSFDLRVYIVPEEDEDYFCLQVDLLINGSVGVGLPTDLTELEKALDSTGEFFIWTCDCGAPGCAGRFKGIRVEHLNDRLSFRDLDASPQLNFTFETYWVRRTFQETLKKGARLAESLKGKKLVSIPDQNRKFFDTLSVFDVS